MKIGIINIEPKVFNTAYMQISQYHKKRGDKVGWWTPITDSLFDHVYCSSLFDFTDKSEIPRDVICGGTGFNVHSRLSRLMEDSDLDYSIYPDCRKSFLWFSRGCHNKCPWCVVPRKEGDIHPVTVKNLNPRGDHVVVCDNSFFANPEWREAISYLKSLNSFCDFQGIDIRDITEEQVLALSGLPHYKQIKFAWDVPGDEERVLAGIRLMVKYIKPYKLMCYVLIGFNSSEEQDLHRIKTLRGLKIDPYIMPYNKKDLYQRSLARWVNHKAIFRRVPWEEYRGRIYKQESAGTGWKK
jgi:hypothetical protein